MYYLWQIRSDLKPEVASCRIELKLTLGKLELDIQNISAEIIEQIKENACNNMEAGSTNESLPNLPKTEMPTFSGDARDWDLFQELYSNLIHTRESLSTSLKFNYSKSALKGRKVFAHLLLGSADNYDADWKLLTKRYENHRKLFSEQFNRSMDLSIFVPGTRRVKEYTRYS